MAKIPLDFGNAIPIIGHIRAPVRLSASGRQTRARSFWRPDFDLQTTRRGGHHDKQERALRLTGPFSHSTFP